MNIKNYVIMSAVFLVMSGCVVAVEVEPFKVSEHIEMPDVGKIGEEKAAQEIKRMQERIEESKQEIERVQTLNNQLAQEFQKDQSKTDLLRQIGELAVRQTKLEQQVEQAQDIVNDPQAQDLLKKYKNQLAAVQEEVAPSLPPVTVGTVIEKFELAKNDWHDVSKLKAVTDVVGNNFKLNDLFARVDASNTIQEKLNFIDQYTRDVQKIRETVEQEIKTVNPKLTSGEYVEQLKKLQIDLNGKLLAVATVRLDQIQKNVSWWNKIAYAVTDWLNGFIKSLNALVKPTISGRGGIIETIQRAYTNNASLAHFDTQLKSINDYRDVVSTLLQEVGTLNKEDLQEVQKMLQQGELGTGEPRYSLRGNLESFIESFATAQAQGINNAFNKSQELGAVLFGFAQRYQGEFPTLFEKIHNDVRNQFGTNADQVYELIGLDSTNRQVITQQDIDQAVAAALTKVGVGTPAEKTILNAAFVLKNPVWRVTYDAFLDDVQLLQQRYVGIDLQAPLFKAARETLQGGSGGLRNLAITAQDYNNLVQTANTHMVLPVTGMINNLTIKDAVQQMYNDVVNIENYIDQQLRVNNPAAIP